MLAAIVTGKADLADVLFLVAVLLFAIVAVVRFAARSVDGGLLALAAAFGFLGLLVL